jgi:hypothetical protein
MAEKKPKPVLDRTPKKAEEDPNRNSAGQFVKGNNLWEIANINRHARRPRKYQDGAALFDAAMGYFEWLEENPIEVEEVSVSQGTPVRYNVKKKRPPTFSGLQVHLGIVQETWQQYMKKPDYQPHAQIIDALVRNDKLEGALVGIYNAAVAIRDLGLADKQQVSSVVVNMDADDSAL